MAHRVKAWERGLALVAVAAAAGALIAVPLTAAFPGREDRTATRYAPGGRVVVRAAPEVFARDLTLITQPASPARPRLEVAVAAPTVTPRGARAEVRRPALSRRAAPMPASACPSQRSRSASLQLERGPGRQRPHRLDAQR